MGNGRYSALLDYSTWFEFNNAQRAHYNYVEGASTVVTELVLAGLVYPKFAASLGVVYLVGRWLYAAGYSRYGASGRGLGAGLLDVALVGLLGAALAAGWRMAGVGTTLAALMPK